MKIPPSYQITQEILALISKIDAYLISFSVSNTLELSEHIIRKSILKSSLYSARIEGNTNTYTSLSYENDKSEQKKDIFNIVAATEFIQKNVQYKKQFDPQFLFDLHSIIVSEKVGNTKGFRNEMGAIFNQADVAVYVSPPPEKIRGLVSLLLHYINSPEEQFPLICACMSHLIFEKIHPFVDGNGRVGRLLMRSVLMAKERKPFFLIPFEEYLDEHKNDYYYYLDIGMKNPNEYLLFMLDAYYQKVKQTIQELQDNQYSSFPLLPPRQLEIYQIIKEHISISFDMIRRRFLKVPERTLRYDLKRLVNQKLVVKIGKTRGSWYSIKRDS